LGWLLREYLPHKLKPDGRFQERVSDIYSYIILQLGLAGPAIQLAMTVLREGKKIAADKIREAVREADAAPAPSTRSEKRLADPVHASNRSTGGSRDNGDLVAEMMRDK
jgi:hypothetical protein